MKARALTALVVADAALSEEFRDAGTRAVGARAYKDWRLFASIPREDGRRGW